MVPRESTQGRTNLKETGLSGWGFRSLWEMELKPLDGRAAHWFAGPELVCHHRAYRKQPPKRHSWGRGIKAASWCLVPGRGKGMGMPVWQEPWNMSCPFQKGPV